MTIGIPTQYKGIRFRSRLEARWAAFFDRCRWKWAYEPVDLAGYIPDFIVEFKYGEMLIEIKPSRPSDDFEGVISKIENSGWKGASAILCATWDEHSSFSVRVGVGTDKFIEDNGIYSGYWGDIVLCECAECKGPALVHVLDWPKCLCCGFSGYDFSDEIPPDSWLKLRVLNYKLRELWWAEAGNEVQWKPR